MPVNLSKIVHVMPVNLAKVPLAILRSASNSAQIEQTNVECSKKIFDSEVHVEGATG